MPGFDSDRSADHIVERLGRTYPIRLYGHLPLGCADTGQVEMAPIRMTYSDRTGVHLEIGPYDIDPANVAYLHRMLSTFLRTTGMTF